MAARRRAPRPTVRRKLMAILMLTSGGALLLACATLAAHSHLRFRDEVQANLVVLASVVAENTRVSFEQGDRRLAEYMLAGLSANRHVVAAGLYGPDGRRHASFLREPPASAFLPQRSPLQASSRFLDETIEICHPVFSGQHVVGTVVLVSDKDLIHDHLMSFTLSLPLVLLAATGFAFLLSRRLQQLISRPIRDLSGVAREVSRRQDYSLRVVPLGESVETEALAQSFNEMLDTIQHHERELTESRDAAEKATRIKTEFLANVSHEIRTPMNGVIGLTDLLQKGPLTNEQLEYTRIIQSSGQTLLHLINDVLDLTKVEAGMLELEDIQFEVREVFENALNMLAGRAVEKQLDLNLRIEHDVPVTLGGDPVRLQQVVINLLSNAVKFTDQGEVFVHVRRATAMTVADDRVGLEVAVLDTGIGLADDARERIFQSFIQADGSTTRRFGGTGLGLALCKQLVTRMGGEIDVDSEPGRGSTFRFTCDLGCSGGEGLPGVSAEFAGLRGRGALVVSESAREREIIAHHLELLGVACQEMGPENWSALVAEARGGDVHDFALLSDGVYEAPAQHQARAHDRRFPVIVVTPLGTAAPDRELPGFEVCAQLNRPLGQRRLLQCLQRLPFLEGDRARTPAAALTEDLASETETQPRILVAEDHPVNQKVIRAMLDRLGYPFDLVETGTGVLDALASDTRYGLILMDCQMPEMDGNRATRLIRASEREGTRIPIIALTAAAGAGERDQILAAGMDDYLAKPVMLEELGRTLTRWLNPLLRI